MAALPVLYLISSRIDVPPEKLRFLFHSSRYFEQFNSRDRVVFHYAFVFPARRHCANALRRFGPERIRWRHASRDFVLGWDHCGEPKACQSARQIDGRTLRAISEPELARITIQCGDRPSAIRRRPPSCRECEMNFSSGVFLVSAHNETAAHLGLWLDLT
jgi:hypothetical protein